MTTESEELLTEILAIKKLGPWEINATKFARASRTGVIDNVHWAISNEEIDEEIETPIEYTKAERIFNGSKATSSVKISFNSPDLPKEVRLGLVNYHVREFIPDPIQCYKCRIFGHIAKDCNGKQKCARCQQQHEKKTARPKEKILSVLTVAKTTVRHTPAAKSGKKQ